MAKKIDVTVNFDTTKAQKNVKDLDKDVKDLGDAFVDTGEKGEDASNKTKKAGDSAEKAGDKAKKSSKGMGMLSKAMRFTGIGAVDGAFMAMCDVLMGNQAFADKFNIALEVTKIVVSDLFNKIGDLIVKFANMGSKVSDVKGNFNRLNDSISDFGKLMKEKISDRVKQIIGGFGSLGKAMQKLFEGDFKGAWETAKEGVNDILAIDEKIALVQKTIEKSGEVYQKVKNKLGDLVEGTEDYANEVIKSAVAIVQSRNEMIKLTGEIEQQKVAIQSLINTETKKRDNENLTFEERKAASIELLQLEADMIAQNKLMAQAKIDNARAELRTNADNLQAKQKLALAEVELEKLKEQDIQNTIAQTQSYHDLTKAQSESLREIEMLNKFGQQREIEELKDHHKALLEQVRKNGGDETEVLEHFERKKEEIRKKYRDVNLRSAGALMGALKGTQEKGSKSWKMMAKAQALVNMYLGITTALKDPELPAFARWANVLAVGITGMNNIKAITKTKMSGEEGEGEDTTSALPVGVGGGFSGNIESMIPNQLSEELTDVGTQPVQAYVVESDISDSQALQEELNLQTTL